MAPAPALAVMGTSYRPAASDAGSLTVSATVLLAPAATVLVPDAGLTVIPAGGWACQVTVEAPEEAPSMVRMTLADLPGAALTASGWPRTAGRGVLPPPGRPATVPPIAL